MQLVISENEIQLFKCVIKSQTCLLKIAKTMPSTDTILIFFLNKKTRAQQKTRDIVQVSDNSIPLRKFTA